jgi:hypothetical protein
LLVAEKYQTGFDQPLLHSMYVDKRLSGIQAVQTLSRLNRTTRGKTDTFVLDFVNEPADIYTAFKPYYEATDKGDDTDPQQLNTLAHTLANWKIYTEAEVSAWCEIWFRNRLNPTGGEHKKLNGLLDLAIERFKKFGEEEQNLFKGQLVTRGARPGAAALQPRGAQSTLEWRHHLHRHGRGLAVPGRCHRPVWPPGGGLEPSAPHAGQSGQGRTGHGVVASAPSGRFDIPQRQGQSILQWGVPSGVERLGHALIDEQEGQLLG